MMAWALFCHDFDLSKGINILSEKCPVVLDHYRPLWFTPTAAIAKDEVMAKLANTPDKIIVFIFMPFIQFIFQYE